MAESSRSVVEVAGSLVALAATVLLVAGCAAGNGNGVIFGEVVVPGCFESSSFVLEPRYYGADTAEEATQIIMQRTSGMLTSTDGMLIEVINAPRVARELLGVPIVVGDTSDALVTMNLFMNQTCSRDYAQRLRTMSVNVGARSGTITFDRIYAPQLDASRVEISGHFSNVLFFDEGDGRPMARLSGSFRFFYNRGRPAQRFP